MAFFCFCFQLALSSAVVNVEREMRLTIHTYTIPLNRVSLIIRIFFYVICTVSMLSTILEMFSVRVFLFFRSQVHRCIMRNYVCRFIFVAHVFITKLGSCVIDLMKFLCCYWADMPRISLQVNQFINLRSIVIAFALYFIRFVLSIKI